MCGIIGTTTNLDRTLLNLISHRGPDGRGIFTDDKHSISLGHTRLSIIDIDNGQQPMSIGGITIVYNGETYNYIEIRDYLIKTFGENFLTSSDTEVILRLYKNLGIKKTLNMLNGMFALAILDNRNNNSVIYLARDRMGVKPLFYYMADDNLMFCSEINPLKKMIGLGNLTINPMAVSIYFNTYYIPSPLTIWNEITSLEKGSYLEYNLINKACENERYWCFPEINRKHVGDDELNDTLSNATMIRMRSDVPYGGYLSGGIDSTLIIKYMSGYDSKVKTFTAEIEGELNEQSYAKMVSDKFKTSHKGFKVTDKDVNISFLREILWHFGQPFADSSMIPTHMISGQIAKDVTVALSGDGADELFAGYDKYVKQSNLKNKFFRNVNSDFLATAYQMDSLKYLVDNLPYVPSDDKELLRMMDINYFLEGDVLQKVDRTSMANSLETRSPFLDYRMVEISNRISYDLMFNNISRKMAIKRLLCNDFDRDFVFRPKIGFMLPIEKYCHRFDEYLNKYNFNKVGIFGDKFEINSITDGYLRFAILMFLLWWEENFE